MVCYRRRGHNEADDPSMTQPLMYNLIETKRSVRKLYTEALIGRGDITVEEAEAGAPRLPRRLEQAFAETTRTTDARRTSHARSAANDSERPRQRPDGRDRDQLRRCVKQIASRR